MDSTKELISIGRQCFDNKDYVKAEQCLRQVLERNVRYADVLNMLGVISHVQGRFGNAIDFFRQALEINPRYTEAILNLAVLYNDLGQYSNAKKLYDKLRKHTGKVFAQIEPVLRGKLSNLHADIGDIYRSIGLHSFAIEEYRKALSLNPGYFDIRTKLAQALREDGLLDDSIKELRKVLRSEPSYCPALIQQGITFYAMENISGAKKSWKTALDTDPDNKYAQMYLRLCDATARAFEVSKPKAKNESEKPSKKSPKGKKGNR